MRGRLPLCVLLLAGLQACVQAFYLPGVAPQDFKRKVCTCGNMEPALQQATA